jgi:hypothetical protein
MFLDFRNFETSSSGHFFGNSNYFFYLNSVPHDHNVSISVLGPNCQNQLSGPKLVGPLNSAKEAPL